MAPRVSVSTRLTSLPTAPVLAAAATSRGIASAAGLSAPALAAPREETALVARSIHQERDHLVVGADKVKVTYDKAFEGIRDSVLSAREELQATREDIRVEARGWYRASLLAGAAGFVLLSGAVGALIFGFTTAGIITTVGSVVPNGAALLFFRQKKKADDRLDQEAKRMNGLNEIYAAVEVAQTIDDPKLRNELKAEIVRMQLAKNRERLSSN